jgi:hypothetical protein
LIGLPPNSRGFSACPLINNAIGRRPGIIRD